MSKNWQEIVTPDVLYEEVIEADERVALKKEECKLNLKGKVKTGVTGEQVVLGYVYNETVLDLSVLFCSPT